MTDIPNHVLVTGADGLLGRVVVAYVRSIGVRVTAHPRGFHGMPRDLRRCDVVQ